MRTVIRLLRFIGRHYVWTVALWCLMPFGLPLIATWAPGYVDRYFVWCFWIFIHTFAITTVGMVLESERPASA